MTDPVKLLTNPKPCYTIPTQDMDSSSQPSLKSMRGGKIFLSLLAVVIILLLAFFALVGYYMLKIYSGNGAELTKQFQNARFTRVSNSQSAPNDLGDNGASLIRRHNPTIGKIDAPVTIFEFIDFECPFCQESYPIFKRVTEKYAPVVRVVFKHFPIDAIHPNAVLSANAGACAGEQKKFWEYYDTLFREKTLEKNDLFTHAQSLHLSSPQFATCLKGRKYQISIDEDLADGLSVQVRGTPTYFVNGKRVEGVIDEAAWDRVILDALKSVR